jgi:hypothetical protein
MSKREVAELACRILALYYLVVNLHSFVTLPITLGMGVWNAIQFGGWDATGIGILFIGLGTGCIIALVWFLWTRAWWIAEKLVPHDANYSRWPRVRAQDMQVVAFSMVGLFTLVNSFQSLARSFGMYVGVLNSDEYGERRITFLEWLTLEGALGSLIGCILGLWLVLGSRGLVRLIRRLRRPEFDELTDESTAGHAESAPPLRG